MIDKILDAILDSLKLIPFLFISFLIMELIEHKINSKEKLTKVNKYGPLLGATLGIIPQCGFSALASNLYTANVITLGTLFSIYLSTSDEMIPILITNQASPKTIFELLITKFSLGLTFGIIIDLIYRQKTKNEIKELCQEEHCHCEKGIFVSSIIHTLKITAFILLVNIFINILLDRNAVINYIKTNKILTPIITSIIGLIPNCASSIIITELYLSKVITFGSCISGLLSSSGVGLLVLFKQNKNLKENLLILLTLILISSICGIIFNLI